jgi:predicted GNAT family acetyltransferase
VWALACGYVYSDYTDEWYDDEGYAVDIQWKAIDEASEGGFFGTVGTSEPTVPLPPKVCPTCGCDYPTCEGEAYEDGMYYVYMQCRVRCTTWTEEYAYVQTTEIRKKGDK